MPARTGINILLKIEDPVTPGTYITLGGQRNVTLSRTTSTADATSKDGNGFEEHLPVLAGWTVECDALWLSGDTALEALMDAWRNRTTLKVQVDDNGTLENGDAIITELSSEGPHDDVATVSVSLQGTGALTATP